MRSKRLYREIREHFVLRWAQMIEFQKKTQVYVDNRRQKKLFSDLYLKYKNFTMVPRYLFIENLRLCNRLAKIDGCVVECGTWKGGVIAAMTYVLGSNRKYYLFDSFEGLPPAKGIDGEAALKWQQDTTSPNYFNNCNSDIKFAERAMKLSNAKDYELVKGWFCDTLPSFKPETPIALLRLDCDWYDSTLECLNTLYKYVSKGGLIIIDDYYTWDGCSKAVHHFLSSNQLSEKINQRSNSICWIVKN